MGATGGGQAPCVVSCLQHARVLLPEHVCKRALVPACPACAHVVFLCSLQVACAAYVPCCCPAVLHLASQPPMRPSPPARARAPRRPPPPPPPAPHRPQPQGADCGVARRALRLCLPCKHGEPLRQRARRRGPGLVWVRALWGCTRAPGTLLPRCTRRLLPRLHPAPCVLKHPVSELRLFILHQLPCCPLLQARPDAEGI